MVAYERQYSIGGDVEGHILKRKTRDKLYDPNNEGYE